MTRAGIALLLVVSAVSAFGSPRLETAETVCVGCRSIVGDFNGDGLDDFMAATGVPKVYFNLGGRFDAPVVAAGFKERDVITDVADFNDDGLDDVIMLTPGSPIGVGAYGPAGPHRLKLNAGSGRFIDGPSLPGFVGQVLDFDGDGKPDILIAVTDAEKTRTVAVNLMRGNGDGTFTFHQTLPFPDGKESSPPFGVGDLNSDGRPDLVQPRGPYLYFYFGGADGQFSAPRARFTFMEPQEQHVSDLNGDGHLDLAFISWFGYGDGRVSALFGDGTGRFPSFSHLVITTDGRGPRNLAIADFYAGGATEIAVGTAENRVLMLSGMGNQLREVARLDVASILDPAVYAGRFRREATYDLMVYRQQPEIPLQHVTDFVLAEGSLEPAEQVRQARVGSRTRSVRTLTAKMFEGTYDVHLQSDCGISLPIKWTLIEEGLFADFVTGPGLRIEGAVIDGGINARFSVDDGARTRTFEGLFQRAGNVLQGRFYEYDPPCGGRWATHEIELTRSGKR